MPNPVHVDVVYVLIDTPVLEHTYSADVAMPASVVGTHTPDGPSTLVMAMADPTHVGTGKSPSMTMSTPPDASDADAGGASVAASSSASATVAASKPRLDETAVVVDRERFMVAGPAPTSLVCSAVVEPSGFRSAIVVVVGKQL